MKILITGATGFIGSNLILKLKERKNQIIAMVQPGADLSLLKTHSIRIISGDITDYDQVSKALEGVDVVFHLAAALPHHRLSIDKYWQINATGTENILKACVQNKVKRLVHVSTVGIFDKTETAYSRSKREAERLISTYRKRGKLEIVIVRPTIAYGPFDVRPGFFNLFKLIRKNRFVMIGRGGNSFHTVFVGNLVDGLLKAAISPNAVGQDIIIGDDPCPTIGQIVKMIAKVESRKLPPYYLPVWFALVLGKLFDAAFWLHLPAILPTRRVRFITDQRKYDLSVAKRVLNYKPRYSLEDGIRLTYDWYRDKGYLR